MQPWNDDVKKSTWPLHRKWFLPPPPLTQYGHRPILCHQHIIRFLLLKPSRIPVAAGIVVVLAVVEPVAVQHMLHALLDPVKVLKNSVKTRNDAPIPYWDAGMPMLPASATMPMPIYASSPLCLHPYALTQRRVFGTWLGQDQDYLGESPEWLFRCLLLL
jgi:hypothetical protein